MKKTKILGDSSSNTTSQQQQRQRSFGWWLWWLVFLTSVISLSLGEMACHLDQDTESVVCYERTTTATNNNNNQNNKQHEKEEEEQQQQAEEPVREFQVGKALYRPPYSQYGESIASVLELAPSLSSTYVAEWADWYLNLGITHLENFERGGDEKEDDGWYQLELATNALERSVSVFDDDPKRTKKQVSKLEKDQFLANVYFTIGEAYSMDPGWNHLQSALKYYQQSRHLYQQMVEEWSSRSRTPPRRGFSFHLWNRDEVEYGYALACAKEASTRNHLIDEEKPQQEMLSDVESLFETAISILRKQLLSSSSYSTSHSDDDDGGKQAHQRYYKRRRTDIIFETSLIEIQTNLAWVLQDAASVAALAGKLSKSKDYLLQAIVLYLESILSNTSLSKQEQTVANIAVASIYIALSDTALQLGEYPLAKSAYQKAMEWYVSKGVPVEPFNLLPEEKDEYDDVLQQTIDSLQHYRQHSQGTVSSRPLKSTSSFTDSRLYDLYNEASGGGGSNDDVYYERDDGYEADMLMSIGSIYMSMGETTHAIPCLEQAIALYNSNGESKSPAMADTKNNLAVAYFLVQRFQDSQTARFEALDLYQTLYGDNVNPYLQNLEDTMLRGEGSENLPMRKEKDDSAGKQDSSSFEKKKPGLDLGQKINDLEEDKNEFQKKLIEMNKIASSIKNITEALSEVEEAYKGKEEL